MIDCSQNHSNDKIHRESNSQSSAVCVSFLPVKCKQFFGVVSTVTELEAMQEHRDHLEQSQAAQQKGREGMNSLSGGWAGLGTHHLIRGRPHHARQHVQQVLPLEKLEHKGQTQITAEQTTAKNSFPIPNLSFPCVTDPAQKQAHSLHRSSFSELCSLKSDELWDCSIPGAGLCISLCSSSLELLLVANGLFSLQLPLLHYTSGFRTLPASTCSLVPTLRGRTQVCTNFPSRVCTQNSVSEREHKCQAGIPCCSHRNGKVSRT